MATIVTRAGKGSPLTQAEVDQNFINLNTDKLDTSGLALGSAASPSLKFTGDPNTGIYSPGADQLAFSTSGTERLKVDSAGNITFTGVGVKLIAGRNLAPTLNDGSLHLNGGDITTSPGANIELYGGAHPSLANLMILDANEHRFRTADGITERARIDSSGNVFLNTAVNPTTINATGLFNILQDKAACDVINIKHTVDGNNSINIWQTGTTVFNALTFYKGNTQTSVGGISVSTTATSYNTSSDYRLKENIVSLTGAVERLNQLQVHRFNFLADPDHTVDGFIAHEAQAIVPECVTGEKDAVDSDGNPVYQGIDQSKMLPLAIAAIQECVKRIEALESEAELKPTP